MFDLKKIENGTTNVGEPYIYPAKSGIAISAGQALVFSSGELVAATGTTKPEYVSVGKVGAADENRDVAVIRVAPDQVYEVSVTAAPTSLKVGSKVTISSDGTEVTATTTDGVATIVNLCGATAIGDRILVRFA